MAAGLITKDTKIGTLTTGETTIYQATGNVGLFLNMRLTNKDTVARTTNGLIYNDGSPAVGAYAWKESTSLNPIQPGETREYPLGPIKDGYALRCLASANSAIDYVCFIAEEEQ